jgi:perosamine synthetase
VATPQAIIAAGAKPIFCEVHPDSLNIDVADARSRVTPATRAVIPVHYGGVACDMDALSDLITEFDLVMIEDAAQAFGSTHGQRALGTFGRLGCFSFDPIKNITCGSGGAIVTGCGDLARSLEASRNLGIDQDSWSRLQGKRSWRYGVRRGGYRYHMSDLNAAIGLTQLGRIEQYRERKTAIARAYDTGLEGLRSLQVLEKHLDQTFPFSYCIRVMDGTRDRLADHLGELGIDTTVRFIPNHLHALFKVDGVSLPITERLFQEILTLPLYYELKDEDVSRVIDGVRSFFGTT